MVMHVRAACNGHGSIGVNKSNWKVTKEGRLGLVLGFKEVAKHDLVSTLEVNGNMRSIASEQAFINLGLSKVTKNVDVSNQMNVEMHVLEKSKSTRQKATKVLNGRIPIGMHRSCKSLLNQTIGLQLIGRRSRHNESANDLADGLMSILNQTVGSGSMSTDGSCSNASV